MEEYTLYYEVSWNDIVLGVSTLESAFEIIKSVIDPSTEVTIKEKFE